VASICIKSGNAVILKGGSDAKQSNQALFNCIKTIVPEGMVQLVEDRKTTETLLKMDQYIDVVIPRGGKGLIETVMQKSRIPVIKHYEGICNIFVDQKADLENASKIILNAKVQKPGVCNAVENLIIHKNIAKKYLPGLKKGLEKYGVEIRGCDQTKIIIDVGKATEEDFRTEYLAKIISIKIVNDIDEAIEFVNEYGSGHSDAIITENNMDAEKFLKSIDSSTVYHNASTRFTDGGCFGMGCEMGISTDKLHARGPMGLEEMTTYKYVVIGNGQIRE